MLLISAVLLLSAGSAAGAHQLLVRSGAPRTDVLLGSYRAGALVFVTLAPAAAVLSSYQAAVWTLLPAYVLWTAGVGSAAWYAIRARRSRQNRSR